jgi:hypothetical protein
MEKTKNSAATENRTTSTVKLEGNLLFAEYCCVAPKLRAYFMNTKGTESHYRTYNGKGLRQDEEKCEC